MSTWPELSKNIQGNSKNRPNSQGRTTTFAHKAVSRVSKTASCFVFFQIRGMFLSSFSLFVFFLCGKCFLLCLFHFTKSWTPISSYRYKAPVVIYRRRGVGQRNVSLHSCADTLKVIIFIPDETKINPASF